MANVKREPCETRQDDNSGHKRDVPESVSRHTSLDNLGLNPRKRQADAGPVRQRTPKRKPSWREVDEVRSLLDRTPEQEAIEAAVKWIGRWMELAICAPLATEGGYVNRIPARTFVRRLAHEQADPQTCLEHIAGCWCYMARNPNKYNTRRSYILGLGSAFLQVKPIPSREQKLRLTTRSRTEAGEHIFQTLLPLLVRINKACLIHKHDDKGLRDALLEPWDELTQSARKCIQRLNLKQRGELARKLNEQQRPAREGQ